MKSDIIKRVFAVAVMVVAWCHVHALNLYPIKLYFDNSIARYERPVMVWQEWDEAVCRFAAMEHVGDDLWVCTPDVTEGQPTACVGFVDGFLPDESLAMTYQEMTMALASVSTKGFTARIRTRLPCIDAEEGSVFVPYTSERDTEGFWRRRHWRDCRESGTLPTLYVTLVNDAYIATKTVYQRAAFRMVVPGEDDIVATGQIRGRGNSTWYENYKPPYRIKFDIKESVLGLAPNRHFALLTIGEDHSDFFRTPLGFMLSERAAMEWTPSTRPVELVVNGDYYGIFYLTETIRVDDTRLNIKGDAPGHWLVEIDNYDDPNQIAFHSAEGHNMRVTWHDPETPTEEDKAWLLDQFHEMDSLISHDPDSPRLWEMMDLESAARYFMVAETVQDCDAYNGSAYLYRRGGDDEKWHWGPMWDFSWTLYSGQTEEWLYESARRSVWLPRLLESQRFRAKVRQLWNEGYYDGLLDAATAMMDTLGPTADDALYASAQLFPVRHYHPTWEIAEYTRSFLSAHGAWLDGEINAWSGLDAVDADTVAPVAPRGVYDITGRRLGDSIDGLAPGLYIVDGRKRFVGA